MHLSQYGKNCWGKKRLEQSGNKGSRKKTNNKWFELQDSIAYWEDFNKQKVIWKRIGSVLKFAFDSTGLLILDSACFATGSYAKYLTVFLNSKMCKYMLQNAPMTGTGDLLISIQAIEPLKIPLPDSKTRQRIEAYVNTIEASEQDIDTIIYNLYSLSQNEIYFIEKKIH